MGKFKSGDKVVEIGTKEPVMEVRGHTVKPNKPTENYIIKASYTCFWQTHEPHWKDFDETQLEFSSDNQDD
jgi:hypothetical protein